MMTIRRSTLSALLLPLLYACSGYEDGAAGSKGVPGSSSQDGGTSAGGPGAAADGGAGPLAAGAACPDFDKNKHVYFGDLHTHTAYSADSSGFGNRNMPADAWAFARGKPLQIAAGIATPGPTVTIAHKLDFDAITDHSEWLAATFGCETDAAGNLVHPELFTVAQCAEYTKLKDAKLQAIVGANTMFKTQCANGEKKEEVGICLPATQSAWQAEQQMANAANDPCTFTALIGYEWTSADSTVGAPGQSATLHKNVIFSGTEVPDRPFDSLDFIEPTQLWSALDTWHASDPACKDAPCDVLTIPHNSNKSFGLAFKVPETASGIDQMQRYQKLVEVHQHKGSSECFFNPATPNVEPQCDFEQLDYGDGAKDGPVNPKNFIRTGLNDGITSYAANRVNPLQLGFVGATDDHNGMPGNVNESNYNGHAGSEDVAIDDRLSGASATHNPGGITGVWAEQNTRASIFAALSRRETFATSGIFVSVRFYQSWDATDYCTAGFPGNVIDSGGIAMGGTMKPQTGSPWFYISALKDDVDLERIDMIKSTVVNGQAVEKVTLIPAPNPGAFCTRWQDTTYDPTAASFYYARVLQVPTPRWSSFDCAKRPNADGCEAGGKLNVNIRERAWTSPIWSLP